uniref:NADH dehydrogenase subunit 1 n=1 Tax=Lamproglena chinensis TaxID=342427 RepID=UPI00286C452E|nr:NADH dehydrogenase subunit 1 [Lamproglena chinensis]WKF18927.1 NADH dehydrogenase subunit 1 [Lamproglena chinensis]
MTSLDYLIWMIFILVNVAFITLLERKLLSYQQNRVGPNKVSVSGILQPFSDAIKLFTKNILLPSSSVKILFMLAPVTGLTLMLSMWASCNGTGSMINSDISILIFLALLSMSVYPLLMAGWVSNSKYAFLGALRAVAQTISYEIVMALFLFILMYYKLSTNIIHSDKMSCTISLITLIPILLMMWVAALMAESNRTPFDFSEGESELVSGFNVEYSGALFALIFMAEYGMIFFMSTLTVAIFICPQTPTQSSLFTLLLVIVYIWLRATYPRHRYDLLMLTAWKNLLPTLLSLIILQLSFV